MGVASRLECYSATACMQWNIHHTVQIMFRCKQIMDHDSISTVHVHSLAHQPLPLRKQAGLACTARLVCAQLPPISIIEVRDCHNRKFNIIAINISIIIIIIIMIALLNIREWF